MKTLLLYYSKHGACADLAGQLQRALSCDMQRISMQVSCAGYDTIIIGASVYIGMLNKEVKEFVASQQDYLKTCRVCMFTLGMQQGDVRKVIVENLGNEFYESLFYYDEFGGRITMKSLSFIERNIIRMINKKTKLIDTLKNDSVIDSIDEMRIKTFIERVSNDA